MITAPVLISVPGLYMHSIFLPEGILIQMSDILIYLSYQRPR